MEFRFKSVDAIPAKGNKGKYRAVIDGFLSSGYKYALVECDGSAEEMVVRKSLYNYVVRNRLCVSVLMRNKRIYLVNNGIS